MANLSGRINRGSFVPDGVVGLWLTTARGYWYYGTTGHRQRDDFWPIISERVKVYRGEILKVEEKTIHLTDGKVLQADAIFCGTGWKPSHHFFSEAQRAQFGLPIRLDHQSAEQASLWTKLEVEANRRVIKDFPTLAHSPLTANKKAVTTTPYRLYNGMASPHDPSIVFVGHIQIANSFRAAECQALWAVAYLDQRLDLPSHEAMLSDIAYINAWSRRHYPTNGQVGNFYEYELVGYTDKLLREVGVKSHLQKGLLEFRFGPCRASDLKGIREEYVQLGRGHGLRP